MHSSLEGRPLERGGPAAGPHAGAPGTPSGGDAPETVRNAVRVVYIAGYGRSGSTVLDALLGAHPAACNLGELGRVARAAWLGAEFCSCGVPAADCPFWSDVRARFERAGGDPERLARLGERLESGRLPLLRALAGRRPRGGAAAAWAAEQRRLLEAVRAASGKAVLVDATKSPARGLLLASLAGVEVFGVHLVRDARAVAWSLARAFERDARAGLERALRPRSGARTALAWSVVNRAAERALAALPPERRARLRYEDYVLDPAAALAPLAGFLGPGLDALARAVAAGATLAPGHTVAGNRLRMAGPIALAPDTRWRAALPARERARVERLAGGLLRRYGYAP